MSTEKDAKKRAGYYAADMVEDGMAVGLGTGSTVYFALERLAERIRGGLDIVGVPTSSQTSIRAREYGIPLTGLGDCCNLDIAIDGADQVDRTLCLIKGRGAAQTREKCVAEAAKKFVVVISPDKMTERLATIVPVEVLPFSASLVCTRLVSMGGRPVLRDGVSKDGPVVTDNGNWIVDCDFGPIADPCRMESAIETIPGVLCCGLFTRYTEKTTVVVGGRDGIQAFSLTSAP